MLGAQGIWILVVGEHAPRVSLPSFAMSRLADRAQRWTRALVGDPFALARAIEPLEIERIVGPAFIGYGTAQTLDLSSAPSARELTRADTNAVARLRAACSPVAWGHGGSDLQAVPCFGCFDDRGALCALAGYKTWGGAIAHIAIVTAPSHQGRGHATAAVACAAQHALAAGLLAQYRTLASNGPSMGVAKKLGFQHYGSSVFVRLAASE